MRAADLLQKLLVVIEDDAEAVVAVWDGVLVAKPKRCAEACSEWQNAALNDSDREPDACANFRLGRTRFGICVQCGHHAVCHPTTNQNPSAFALCKAPATVGGSAAMPAESLTGEASSSTRRADDASPSIRIR